ncbi:MAG: hypothetical protein ACTS43_01560 [Candidatus Hodgkinia cicadicola]
METNLPLIHNIIPQLPSVQLRNRTIPPSRCVFFLNRPDRIIFTSTSLRYQTKVGNPSLGLSDRPVDTFPSHFRSPFRNESRFQPIGASINLPRAPSRETNNFVETMSVR